MKQPKNFIWRVVGGIGGRWLGLGALALASLVVAGCQGTTPHEGQGNGEVAVTTQAAVAPAGAYLESGGSVAMEAENFDDNSSREGQAWVLTSNSAASGGYLLLSSPNSGVARDLGYVTNSPQLNFDVQFGTTGTYYVWIRGIGPTGNDDSCHAGIDGTGPSSAAKIAGFNSKLAWSRRTMTGLNATLTVSQAGLHTINIWMREDGFRIDKLLLTTSSRYVPAGAGPAQSPRSLCTVASECNDNNPCTDDVCANGSCGHAANATACDDGNACTVGDVCVAGTCAGATLSCDDGNPCTNDVCANGSCGHAANATACDDGNACTIGDVCVAGTCAGASMSCDDNNPCTDDVCANGSCGHAANAAMCDDGNACTVGDVCVAGTCAGASMSCDDNNPCTNDVCSNGACGHANNSATCDDGNACTTGDVCSAGSCTAGLAVNCDDNNPCTVDTCTAGTCSSQPLCNDNNPCSDDLCNGGVCQFVGNGTCIVQGAYQESGGTVVIEAENFDHNVVQGDHTWDVLADPLASNGTVMIANPNSGIRNDTTYATTSPRLDFDIQFTTTGAYYVWIRAVATTAEDDSCHAGIDGTAPSSASKISWYSTSLAWSKKTTSNANASLSVTTAGIHTLNIWMREDGIRIDKIVLTASSSYTPSGAGPATSPRPGCDGTDPTNYPGNTEVCDGRDNDCNGIADFANESIDQDHDGVPACSDCNDLNPHNFPGNPEVCDGQDNDCNGIADSSPDGELDADGDGSPACVDCDDGDPANFPGQVELCDGRDNDCDGLADADPAGEVDADNDGLRSCVDCNDQSPANSAEVTFLVHGPPTALADAPAEVRLSGASPLGSILLDAVAPLTWSTTIAMPFRSSATYHFARTEADSTLEVGPWGESLSERRLNVVCSNVYVEDTVWNWDDLTTNGPAAPADKGPTLSITGDGSTSATIAVDLVTAQDATLHYSTESNVYSPENVVVGTGQLRYEFALTGLLPGTTYYYYVEHGGIITSEYSWTTSSASGPPFRFVAYGDSQDQAGHEIHRNVVAQAYAYHPSVVIRTGDQVETGATMSLWNYFFAIERPLLSSAIYLNELGNHEAQAANYFNLFALPAAPANEQYYSVRYNNTLFVGLSTETTVTGAQTTWLSNTLTAANADPTILWKVAYFHQPPYSSGDHGSNTTVRNAWHPLFRDLGVDVVFSGHDHDFEHALVEGVHYLVIGGAGSDLRAVASNSWTVHSESVNHLVVVDVSNQQLAATVLRTDGSQMDQFTLTTP